MDFLKCIYFCQLYGFAILILSNIWGYTCSSRELTPWSFSICIFKCHITFKVEYLVVIHFSQNVLKTFFSKSYLIIGECFGFRIAYFFPQDIWLRIKKTWPADARIEVGAFKCNKRHCHLSNPTFRFKLISCCYGVYLMIRACLQNNIYICQHLLWLS